MGGRPKQAGRSQQGPPNTTRNPQAHSTHLPPDGTEAPVGGAAAPDGIQGQGSEKVRRRQEYGPGPPGRRRQHRRSKRPERERRPPLGGPTKGRERPGRKTRTPPWAALSHTHTQRVANALHKEPSPFVTKPGSRDLDMYLESSRKHADSTHALCVRALIR